MLSLVSNFFSHVGARRLKSNIFSISTDYFLPKRIKTRHLLQMDTILVITLVIENIDFAFSLVHASFCFNSLIILLAEYLRGFLNFHIVACHILEQTDLFSFLNWVLGSQVSEHLNQTVDLFHTLKEFLTVCMVWLVLFLVEILEFLFHVINILLDIAGVGIGMTERVNFVLKLWNQDVLMLGV